MSALTCLSPGTSDRSGSNTAWTLGDAAGTRVKQFFVLPIGTTTVMLDIKMITGERLTDDELQIVEDEMRRRLPGCDFAWKRHQVS